VTQLLFSTFLFFGFSYLWISCATFSLWCTTCGLVFCFFVSMLRHFCVLVLAQKVFWPAFTFISGFGQFVDGGMVAIYWYVYVCACVCVRPRGCGLWLLRFTFRMGIGTNVAGSRLKRFMRLLVIIYGLHICVHFVVIAVLLLLLQLESLKFVNYIFWLKEHFKGLLNKLSHLNLESINQQHMGISFD